MDGLQFINKPLSPQSKEECFREIVRLSAVDDPTLINIMVEMWWEDIQKKNYLTVD